MYTFSYIQKLLIDLGSKELKKNILTNKARRYVISASHDEKTTNGTIGVKKKITSQLWEIIYF